MNKHNSEKDCFQACHWFSIFLVLRYWEQTDHETFLALLEFFVVYHSDYPFQNRYREMAHFPILVFWSQNENQLAVTYTDQLALHVGSSSLRIKKTLKLELSMMMWNIARDQLAVLLLRLFRLVILSPLSRSTYLLLVLYLSIKAAFVFPRTDLCNILIFHLSSFAYMRYCARCEDITIRAEGSSGLFDFTVPTIVIIISRDFLTKLLNMYMYLCFQVQNLWQYWGSVFPTYTI